MLMNEDAMTRLLATILSLARLNGVSDSPTNPIPPLSQQDLAGQIGNEYENCVEKGLPTDQIHRLVDQIIPEFINHNEEPEAVDLLLEVERL